MKKMVTIGLIVVIAVCGTVEAQEKCVDVDQKAFNKTNTNLTITTRDKLSELGYYCDITISWNVTNSTVFNKSKHEEAFKMYQQIYKQSTEASIDGERKAGITKDCLAYAYKVVCAYAIPKCSDGKDVASVD